jgi:hypothetical protein
MKLTSSAHDQYEYMDITERHPHIMFYFPDIHNTGGLFMRIGAGCKYSKISNTRNIIFCFVFFSK